MSTNHQYKSPSYYVRKRLMGNKPAILGLVVIIIAHLAVGLGYLIIPDSSPNANASSLYIQKKTPGFSTKTLKIRRNTPIEILPWWKRIYLGQPELHEVVPVDKDPRVEDAVVYFYRHQSDKEDSLELIRCLRPLMVRVDPMPAHIQWPDSVKGVTYREGNTFHYIDVDEKVGSITLEEMEKEFWDENFGTQTYYLGTDKSGRDLLSRLLLGTRVSLAIGFVSALISLVLGVTLGAVSGFFGGAIDAVIMWFMTVVWSVPGIMLVVVITIALGNKSIWVVFVAVGLTMWVDIARVVRGEILSIKEKLYIEAARAFGLSNRRIIFNHIMPNLIGSIIVISTSNFASAILVEAGLSFMGLGVQPPQPSWGTMIFEGYKALGTRDSWHLVLFPCLCISTMVLAFNLFGNGLRDAYDPQNMK